MDLYRKGFVMVVAFLCALALYWMLAPLRAALAGGVTLAHRGGLLKLLGDTTRAVVYGEGLAALVQGTLVGIGFAIAGLPRHRVRCAGGVSGTAAGGRCGPRMGAGGRLSGRHFAMGLGGLHVDLGHGRVGFRQRAATIADFQAGTGVDMSILTVFIGGIGGISAFGMIGVIIGPVLLTVIAALLRFLDETLSHQPGNGTQESGPHD